MNEKYNGWKNYETWLTNLRLTEWRLTAADFLTDAEIEDAAQAVTEYDYMRICSRLYDRLQHWVENIKEEEVYTDNDLFLDLLRAAFARVDWYEISNNWLSDLVEEVKRNA